MKHNNSDDGPMFIPYDDNNMEHVMAGPDYGQPNSSFTYWNEIDHPEYIDFVVDIKNKIFSNPLLLKTKFIY